MRSISIIVLVFAVGYGAFYLVFEDFEFERTGTPVSRKFDYFSYSINFYNNILRI